MDKRSASGRFPRLRGILSRGVSGGVSGIGLPHALIAAVAAIAAAVLLLGPSLSAPPGQVATRGYPAMVPSTAGAFLMLCVAFATAGTRLRWLGLALLAAALVLALANGAGTLARMADGTAPFNRFSVATAICILLLILCVFKLLRPGLLPVRLYDIAATAAGAVALIDIIGYVFDARALEKVPVFAGMSVPTALCVLAFSTALMLERADRSWLRHMTGPGRGSVSARRLFPVVILGPLVVGTLGLVLTRTHAIEPDLRLTLLTVVLTGTALLAILRSAAHENEAERREGAQEMRMRAVIDGLDAAVFGFDDAGHVHVTNRAADHWVTAAGHAAPADWLAGSSFVDPATRERAAGGPSSFRQLWDAAASGETVVVRERPDDDGAPQTLLLTRGAWHEPGGQQRYLLMMRDVTEESAASRARQQAEKVGLLGEIASGIAHDVANLLGVIRLSADVGAMQRTMSQVAPHLEAIQAACDRGSELTSRVLTFAGREEAVLATLDLAQLLPAVIAFAGRTLPPDVEIHCAALPAPLPVRATPGLLENALLNLVINARNAIVESGQGRRITISVTAAEGEARIEVADDGPGIDARTLRRVEEPFFTTRAESGGTGLGLSTVRKCAEVSGGSFTIRSAPGAGTAACLVLPISALPADTAAPAAAAPPAALAGRRVLYVEDDVAFRNTVKRLLEAAGAEVLAVHTGFEGLDLLDDRAERFDVLLTDLQLPGGFDGADLVAHARSARPGLPAIVLSGLGPDARMPAAATARLLRKPIGARELIAAVAAEIGTRPEDAAAPEAPHAAKGAPRAVR